MVALAETFYVLRISLDRVRPEIWRRVRVSSELPLAGVHVVFQVAMGWEARHLYSFSFGDQRYAASPLYDDDDYDPLDHVTLTKLVTKGDRFTYHYDLAMTGVIRWLLKKLESPRLRVNRSFAWAARLLARRKTVADHSALKRSEPMASLMRRVSISKRSTWISRRSSGCPDYTRFDFLDENDEPLPFSYNADEALDELAWRKMSAEEQLWAVAAFHHWLSPDDDHRAVDIMRTHAIAHATIELQIATSQPKEVGEALRRLVTKDHTRHEAIHAISDVMEDLMETRLHSLM